MNIKNLPIIGLAVVVLAIAVKVFFFSASKVAYIDTAKLMEGSKEIQQIRTKLKAEGEKAKANVDTLTMDFQKALQQHEKGLAKMTPNEKKLSEELLTQLAVTPKIHINFQRNHINFQRENIELITIKT